MKVNRFVSTTQAAFALLVAAYGVVEVLHPSFTDQEIQSSFVDTWEVSAWATLFALAILAVSAVASAFLIWWKPNRFAVVALALTVFAGAITLYNHAVLTNRTTQLTGQNFSGLYGLL